MSTPSTEIVRLTQAYLRAVTEQDKDAAFQALRSQREKESIAALQGVIAVDSTYVHECPKCFVRRTK